MNNTFKKFIVLASLALLLSSCADQKEADTSVSSGFVARYITAAKDVKADPVLDMSVYPDKRFNPNRLTDCGASLDPYACYLTVTYNLFKAEGLESTINSLSNSDIKTNGDCYRISKGLGALLASMQSEGKKLTLLTVPYYACPPSFMEGVYDQVFGTMNFEALEKAAPTICLGMSKEVSWACHYYLGRALMNDKLSDPESAASACMSIPSPDDTKGNHKTMRRSCLSGAWQTFFRDERVLKVIESLKPTAKDIFSFCLTDMSSSKDVCLQEDSPAFWRIPGLGDITDRFKACREISSDHNEIDQCYFGMGRGVSDANNRDNNKIIHDCALLKNEEDSDYCFIASGEALNNKDFISGIENFCTTITSNIKPLCYRALGMQAFGQMGGDHIEASKICSAIKNNEYLDKCQEGVYAGKSRVGFVHAGDSVTVESVYSACMSSVSQSHCYRSALVGIGKFYSKLGGPVFMKACQGVDSRFRADCEFGVGRTAAIYETSASKMEQLCGTSLNCQTGLAENIGRQDERVFNDYCTKTEAKCLKRSNQEYF